MSTDRQHITSGTPWEAKHGYSRALRVGNHVYVSGTTASDSEGNVLGIDDPGEQTRVILEKIAAALKEAGASLRDVVRTRVFVTDISQWEAVSAVHAEYFGDVRPVSTMVEIQRLIHPQHLIEIEVDALISD